MPVQGPQQPGFFLPQAEYFALAPNTHIALGGRRRHTITSGNISIPAGGALLQNNGVLLESPFPATAGVYVHDAWVMFQPGDSTSELAITSSTMGLGLNSAGGTGATLQAYQLGTPVLTQSTPGAPTVALRDQEKLVACNDILSISQSTPFTISPGFPFQLFFGLQWGLKNNDSTNAHAFQLIAAIVYTRLDGIQE